MTKQLVYMHPVSWLLFLALVALLPGLSSYGIIDPSDGLYAEGAREMLELGNYITPHFNYAPFFQKPILIYWLIMCSYRIFGVHEWVARLPSALACVAMIISTFIFASFFVRRRSCVLAALVLASTPLFLVIGHLALIDSLLNLFLSIALFCFFRTLALGGTFTAQQVVRFQSSKAMTDGHAKAGSDPPPIQRLVASHLASGLNPPLILSGNYRNALLGCYGKRPLPAGNALLGYLSLALAVLLKGPVAIVLAFLVVASYIVCSTQFARLRLQEQYRIWCAQIASLKPWLGLAILLAITLPWYISETLLTHGKFFDEFILIQNLGRAQGTVNHQNPWFYYIPCALAGFFPWSLLLIAGIKQWHHIWRQRTLSTLRARLSLFCLCWAIVVFTFFSMIKTKLPTYILPASPPIALLVGLYLDKLNRLKTFRSGKFRYCLTALVSAAVGLAALFVPIAINCYYESHDQAFKELLFKVKDRNASLALFMRDSPAACFYLRRRVPQISCPKELDAFKAVSLAPHLIMVSNDIVNQIKPRLEHLILIDHKGKWYLFACD